MDSPTAEEVKDCENSREEACTDVEPQYESETHHEDRPQEEHLLSVRKHVVGRTHSLPNDSYMFPPLDQSVAGNSTQLHPKACRPQHIGGSHGAQSGSSSSVRSQPEDTQRLTVPSELFRPISPHSVSDSETIPRLPPPQRNHTLGRPLRRQVAVSTDSQEALCSDTLEVSKGLVNMASLGLRPPCCPMVQRPMSVACVQHSEQHSSDPPPPMTQESLVDQEVSLLTSSTEYPVRQSRGLKRFHSVDTRGRGKLLPHSRPLSWLDEPRRHSVEVCSSVESSPQCSHTSTSSGFVSRGDSLQTSTQLPSPRRKKKMSPPCISVDPPDFPSLPPLLPAQETFLRRRAPSSDSKDSFDLTVGEGSGPDRGSPKNTPKLLTLPSFSFEKSNSEH